MSPIDELVPILKKLRLSGILQTLELRVRQAVSDDIAHAEFLYRLLSDEVERRESKQLEKRLRRASFEHNKTLEVGALVLVYVPLNPRGMGGVLDAAKDASEIVLANAHKCVGLAAEFLVRVPGKNEVTA